MVCWCEKIVSSRTRPLWVGETGRMRTISLMIPDKYMDPLDCTRISVFGTNP